MDKSRVLILESSIAITGALKAILQAAYELSDQYEFIFLIPHSVTTRDYISRQGWKVEQMTMIEIRRSLKSMILYLPALILNAFRLRKLIARHQINLVHSNDIYNLMVPMAKLFGCQVNYICHIRFLPNRFPKPIFFIWYKIQLFTSKRILLVSTSLRNMLPNNSKLVVVYDRVILKDESFTNSNSDQTVFLYLGNIIPGKGQDFAIQAFGKIHNTIPSWVLRFVGGDMGLIKNRQFLSKLKQQVIQLGIEQKVEWYPFTEDVVREYKRASIFLNFSESESFSMTCAESLYCGVPTIASKCGGPEEIIDHLETGILVSNRNTDEMATAMITLARDGELRKRMSQHGQEIFKRKFSSSKTSDRLRKIYQEVIQ